MNAKNLLAAVTVLFLVSFAQGAHLAYYDSGLWGQTDRYINDEDMEVPTNVMANWGQTSCDLYNPASTEFSSAYGSMSGEVTEATYWGPGLGTAVTLNASANCYSEDGPSAELWSYGTIGTLTPAYTNGIFFSIAPDAGEAVGEPVQLQWHWIAECFALDGDAHASVSTGGMMYLTCNAMPPTGVPPTGIMWSRPGVTFAGPDSVGEIGSFNAEIGDIIGLFLGADASANLSGADLSETAVSTSMEMLVVPEPATVALLGLGALSLLRSRKRKA